MTKKYKIRLCIVIPAFNEASVIFKLISDIHNKFKKSGYYYKVVVVDDGSVDSTATESKRAYATVIKHILNTGAGGATATGLSYAEQNGFDIAATMDADGQHNPEDALEGVKRIIINNNDLLIGSRLLDSSGMSRTKIIGNKGLSLITKLLFGISSTDSQSGLRIYSRRALENLRWKTSGYEFCSEMLWRAKQLGLKVDEYPIKAIYTEYSKSKGQNNWNAVNIIRSLVSRRVKELLG